MVSVKRRVKSTPKKPIRLSDINLRRSGMKGRGFNRQMQRCILFAHKFFVAEARRVARNGEYLVPLHKTDDRVAACLGIHTKTVQRYMRENMGKTRLLTPGKRKLFPRRIRSVDDFTRSAIRLLIYEYHRQRLHLTLQDLLNKVRERDIDFHGGRETLRKVLHDIGFSYKKKSGQRFLMETPRITLLRTKFLSRFMELKKEGHYFVFLDETWFFQRGAFKAHQWQDDDIRSCSMKTNSVGCRYILIHAGGREGFLDGGGLCYCSSRKPKDHSDYHGEVNSKVMGKYFQELVIPFLPYENCVIVMDNASYHSSQEEEDDVPPIPKMKKQQLVDFLKGKGIEVDQKVKVTELRKMAKMHRDPPKNALKELLRGTGHQILFLPPYHPHFNPIELAWGLVKRYYDAHVGRNNDYSEQMCITILKEALAHVTPEVWGRIVEKVERRIFSEYTAHVPHGARVIQPIIINLQDSDSSDDDFLSDPDDPPVKATESTPPGHANCHPVVKDVNVDRSGKVSNLESVPRRPCRKSLFQLGDNAFSCEHEDVKGLHPSHLDQSPFDINNDVSTAKLVDEVPGLCITHTDRASTGECEGGVVPAVVSLQWSYIPKRVVSGYELATAISFISDSSQPTSQEWNAGMDGNGRLPYCDWSHESSDITENNVAPVPARASVESINEAVQDINLGGECGPAEETACRHFWKDETRNMTDTVQDEEEQERSITQSCIPSKLTLEEAWNRPEDENVVVINGDCLSVADICSLKHSAWVTDKIVNSYLILLANSFNKVSEKSVYTLQASFSFLLMTNHNSVQSWTKNDNIFEYLLVLIPIQLGNHWVLVAVKPKQQTLLYLDSLGEKNSECLKMVFQYITEEYYRKYCKAMPKHTWDLQHASNISRQENSPDCGIFAMWYARCLCESWSLQFDVTHISKIRHTIANEILTCSVLRSTAEGVQSEEVGSVAPTEKRKRGTKMNLLGQVVPSPLDNPGTTRCYKPTVHDGTRHVSSTTLSQRPNGGQLNVQHSPAVALGEDCREDYCFFGDRHSMMGSVRESITISNAVQGKQDPTTLSRNSNIPCNTSVEDVWGRSEDGNVVRIRGDWLLVSDVSSLKPCAWVTDKIINSYLTLLSEHFNARIDKAVYAFYTFFFLKLTTNPTNIERWTKNVNIFEYRLVLIPVHLGNHWVLVVVKPKEQTLLYLDSLGGKNDNCLKVVFQYITDEYSRKHGSAMQKDAWNLLHASEISKQNNSSDCGIFLMFYARCMCESRPLQFHVSAMNDVRRSITREILMCNLDESIFRGVSSVEVLNMNMPPNARSKCVKSKVHDQQSRMPSKNERNQHPSKEEDYIPIGKKFASQQEKNKTCKGVVPERKASSHPLKVPKELPTSMEGVLLVQSATISQKTEVHFKEGRNSQCTGISVIAILHICMKNQPFSRQDLDTIVFDGHNYYMCVKNVCGQQYITPDELITNVEVLGKECNFNVDLCGVGTFDEHLEKELANVIEIGVISYEQSIGSCGFLFVGHTKTVSFVPYKEDKFFMFNSHGVDANNRISLVNPSGVARLFRCMSVTSLARCLAADHPRNGAPWQLFALTFDCDSKV